MNRPDLNPGLSPRALVAASCVLAMSSAVSAQSITDEDFETAATGSFPNCPWLDVGLVDPKPPDPPIPSATIEGTTGWDGQPTKALHTLASIAPSQGAYALVPVSSVYTVAADVRIDQYSDNSEGTAADWPMEIGIGKLDGTTDLAFAPQVGIYAASLTQGWRLYGFGASGAAIDEDLGVPATIGVWYRVQLDLTAATGSSRCRIWDRATDTLLVDTTLAIDQWTPADGVFDRLMLIDGELSEGTTIPNLAAVDNVHFEVLPPNPPGPLGDLNGDGAVNGADLGLLLGNWTG